MRKVVFCRNRLVPAGKPKCLLELQIDVVDGFYGPKNLLRLSEVIEAVEINQSSGHPKQVYEAFSGQLAEQAQCDNDDDDQ